jgi:hypothetical protein
LYNYNHFISNVAPDLQAFDFDIFPNPAISYVNVYGDEDLYSIEILDPTMKLVQIIIKPEKQIDISSLSPGLYYLRATNIFKQSKTKIIIIQNEK